MRPISALLNRDSVDIFFISNSLLLIRCSNLIKTEMILHFHEHVYKASILCFYGELGFKGCHNISQAILTNFIKHEIVDNKLNDNLQFYAMK